MSVPRTSATRIVWLCIKLAICSSILVVITTHVDLRAALERLSGVNLGMFALGTALIVGQHIFAAARWKAVVEACGGRIALRTCITGYLESNFFNQALPSSVGGDAVRIWLAQKSGIHGGIAILSVLLDRAFGLLVLAALTIVGGIALMRGGSHDNAGMILLTVSFGIITGAVVGAAFSAVFPGAKHIAVLKPIYLMSEGVRGVLKERTYAIPVLAGSLISHLITVVAFWILARAIGLDLGLLGALLALPPILLASAAPISISGWGVREATCVAVVTELGLETSENALALGIVFGLSLLAVGLVGGCVWFLESLSQFNEGGSAG